MNRSIVSIKAEHFKLKLRPYGFMLIQIQHHSPGVKLFNYSGCVELREREHSTSFFYNILHLDHVHKEYEFSLFSDEERQCCFLSAIVKYVDQSLQTMQSEVTDTSGFWCEFTEETIGLFHVIAHEHLIEGYRPRIPNSSGKYTDEWLCLFRKSTKQLIKESSFTDLRDHISRINDLLTL